MIRAALQELGIDVPGLWLDYVKLGGKAPLTDVERHVDGGAVLSTDEEDCLVHAVNERLRDAGSTRRIPYSWEDPAPGN